MAVQINTAAVTDTANQIDMLNKQMRDKLSFADSAMRALQVLWEGTAANSALQKYDRIKRSFSAERFSVLNRLVLYMKVQVGEKYEETEQSVRKAASAFK